MRPLMARATRKRRRRPPCAPRHERRRLWRTLMRSAARASVQKPHSSLYYVWLPRQQCRLPPALITLPLLLCGGHSAPMHGGAALSLVERIAQRSVGEQRTPRRMMMHTQHNTQLKLFRHITMFAVLSSGSVNSFRRVDIMFSGSSVCASTAASLSSCRVRACVRSFACSFVRSLARSFG